MNLSTDSLEDTSTGKIHSCVNCYFQCQDGSAFKAQVKFAPYFYVGVRDNAEAEVEAYLRRKYEGRILETEVVAKEDLDMKNHLAGLKHKYLKVSFYNVQDLMEARKEVLPLARRNAQREETVLAYDGLGQEQRAGTAHRLEDFLDNIVEVREYDVPYHVRFCIDTEVRCGLWFKARARGGNIELERCKDLLAFAEVKVV
eukprot:CAMPEP_0118948362 /NCGR_PEP_ID=MMETSP1169-20130426/47673_1 /TAXON_ID=36882 /ORGANISM="Pyramimonas obovata, Strain CCMP722" /LENGTH=199 /DNA_ID=CAMNT_0006894765 /DNA_START=1 /DNA_END=596 /DNA_ORIENTATION=+